MVAQYHQSDVTIESLCKAQFRICLIALRKEKKGGRGSVIGRG